MEHRAVEKLQDAHRRVVDIGVKPFGLPGNHIVNALIEAAALVAAEDLRQALHSARASKFGHLLTHDSQVSPDRCCLRTMGGECTRW